MLKEQFSELEQENSQIEDMFKMDLNMSFYIRLSPKQLMLTLKNDIRALQVDIEAIQNELETFQNPVSFKAWFKSNKIPKRTDQDNLDDFFWRHKSVWI